MSGAAHAIPVESARPFDGVHNKKLGMWLFLGSDAMGFTGLLGAYAVLRLGAGDHWQEINGKYVDMEHSIKLTFFNTFLLICSSVTMVLSLRNLREGNMGKFKGFLAATMLGGIGFLSLQAKEWTDLINSGVTAPSSLFGATFFVLTGFHGFHVFAGVCLLLWALIRGMKGVYTPENSIGIEVVGLYWHFVDLVWIILFTLIYLLPGEGRPFVSDAPAHADEAHPHVNYMAKFWWLVALTAIEVAVAYKVPGGWKLALLVILSVWKAAIVLNHFMHLKSEGLALKLTMAFPLVLIFILVTLFLTDAHFLGYAGT